MCIERLSRCAGFSLIEAVVFIVIVGVALAGVLSVLDLAVSRSADPMLAKQALAIGEAMVDEILSREYAANPTNTANTDPRSAFDDLGDYHGYASSGGIKNRAGAAVAGLQNYSVSVSVVPESGPLETINGVPMRRISVTVTDPAGRTYPFTAYRARY